MSLFLKAGAHRSHVESAQAIDLVEEVQKDNASCVAPTSETGLLVGIVAYNPSIERLHKLRDCIQDDGIALCIIDNHSDNSEEIYREFSDLDGVEVILNEHNRGVAAAVNQLVEHARASGVRYVMSVDQDSLFDKGYARDMLNHFQALEAKQPHLAALGGKVFDIRKKRFERFVRFDMPWRRKSEGEEPLPHPYVSVDFLITSGTILSVASVEQVGPMREDLFIDSVDLEWSFRARDLGWCLAGCDTSHIYQEIGIDAVHVPLLDIDVRIHRPLRYYYMTRNRLFLYRQPYVKWGWMLKDLPRSFLKLAFLSMVSPMRKQIIKEHARGMRDSFKL